MIEQDSKQVDDGQKRRLKRQKRRLKRERKQALLLYSGMTALALIILQAFIPAGPTDVASRISVLAFALVLPRVGVCIFVLKDPKLDRKKVSPFFAWVVVWAPPIGCLFIFIGLVAAFWHMSWYMGVVCLISGLVAAAIVAYTLDSRHQLQD